MVTRSMTQVPRVAVGVIVYKDEKIFLAKSKKWTDRWIVPGGHLDWGEQLHDCVVREVKEELDIAISSKCVAPLTFAVDYNHKVQTILMLHVCRKWEGSPVSLLGQKLQWVKPINLLNYDMPKANIYLKSMLRDWVGEI